jgi:hypothetical protein
MALTKDFSELLIDRIQRQPEFARALLGEAIAINCFLAITSISVAL